MSARSVRLSQRRQYRQNAPVVSETLIRRELSDTSGQRERNLLTHLVIPLSPQGDIELTLDRTNWKVGLLDINSLILGVYWNGNPTWSGAE